MGCLAVGEYPWAHSVWQSPEGNLVDITPHDGGETKILFLRDETVVYSGKLIGSIRQPLTGSPLVAQLIQLMNERDRFMCTTPEMKPVDIIINNI